MGKTVEQIYQKKSQHEHILARPDMYIGTIEPVTDDVWVFDEAESVMKQRKCTWTPGLYKIFDEILVNAADNKVRDPIGQTVIKVWIDEQRVRVYNNGEGIPVQKHREHDLWVPEMIFGYLLTSSNYDDTEAKVTGGRNGFGAKLTNVFSTRFEVETVHKRKKFYMRWTQNMLQHDEPIITSTEDRDYTMITFYPDFQRFNVEGFSEDMMLMMKRRVYDVAGCTDKSLRCYLNGELITTTSFGDYVDLYPTMGEERNKASYSRVNERWEVCVRVSNMGFQQVSFVNSIATTRGGTHVKYILDQIIAKVTEQAKKKSKTEVKPHMIRPHIFLFINCLIENPGFDSQTKETLNTVKNKFGSVCEIPNSMIDYILRSGIVERSVEMANSKLTKEMVAKMKSSDRKQITGIPKLDDANEAGGKHGGRCTLILTEGDSAKTLCTAGLAVKDRDFFGVFPLRGKPLNVRDASLKKIMHCEEIQCVMKIMGLDIRQKYDSVDNLRYGHLMIMSDQDHDGSHIKGLVINFIQYYWPDLLKVKGFLQQFITPIVKARPKGRGGEDKAISFFSMPDYLQWKAAVGDRVSQYEIRYYKGLGTSGAKEGREYFENIERHRLNFVQQSPEDTERIVMAFAKDRVEERKDWITAFKTSVNPNETMDYNVREVSYRDFVDKELILFSVADCERSIPSAIDGFKPGQRKILFSCFKRNLVRSIKVVQLSGYVSEHSAYHHGEQSLVQTIVAMAQDFVGSNNVPLLKQDGQFGTRLQGGKDHAAGRYIFTRLMNLARAIFHPADDYIVEYRDDDGQPVEPFFYVPVIPMTLVNSTSGIGTGFSTNIPSYNPIEIIDNLERLMRGDELIPMQPWYFGFTGTIEEKEKGKFISRGRYTIRPDGVVSITELPVNVWTQNYKKFLEDLREKEVVVQYREHNTDVTVDFEVFVHPQVLQQWVAQDAVEEKLQLREFVHATNIIAFNREGQITKYMDAESLMKEFYLTRLEYYGRRKDYLLGELRRVTTKLENMARFVREVVDGQLIVTRRKKKELLEELRHRQYVPFPPQSKKKVSATAIEQEDEAEETNTRTEEDNLLQMAGEDLSVLGDGSSAETPEVQRASRDYDYLLGMKLWNLTAEMIARLETQLQKAKDDTAALEMRSPKDLWREDLEGLREKLRVYFSEREKEIASIQRKKMEKKRPFDASRLRVPLLSDKARHALQKEAEKIAKSTGRRLNGDDAASSVGGAAEDGDQPAARRKPAGKRAKRRKRRRDSDDDDDDDSLDESWLDDGESDSGEDEKEIVGMGDGEDGGAAARLARKPAPKKPASRAGSSSARATRTATAPSSRQRAKKETATTTASAAAAAAPPGSTGANDDDFDLDGFGLDAISSSTPQVKYETPFPSSAERTGGGGGSGGPARRAAQSSTATRKKTTTVVDDDDDDDLTLLGLASKPPAQAARTPPKTRAPKTASARPRATPKRGKRRSGSDSDFEEESDSSSGGSSSAAQSSISSSSDTSDDSYDFSD